MAHQRFDSMLYRTPRQMHNAIAETWLCADGFNSRTDMKSFLLDLTDEQLADEAIATWGLDGISYDSAPVYRDFDRRALIAAFASIRENFDEHFPTAR